jgi:hypothetical protein
MAPSSPAAPDFFVVTADAEPASDANPKWN